MVEVPSIVAISVDLFCSVRHSDTYVWEHTWRCATENINVSSSPCVVQLRVLYVKFTYTDNMHEMVWRMETVMVGYDNQVRHTRIMH